mmetsp:Transcript_12710/g.37406  ORF Transcript_12710/g.37406 Transcript_12710/m.37406 type:complete len:298 (-) Transcript_12710:742-1635(-)
MPNFLQRRRLLKRQRPHGIRPKNLRLFAVATTVLLCPLYFFHVVRPALFLNGMPADESGKHAVEPADESNKQFVNNNCDNYQRGDGRNIQSGDAFLSASAMSKTHGHVMLQMFNYGYINMTKSWICNVRKFDGILERTLFVATDQAGYDAIQSFDPNLNVALEPYEAPAVMTYGQFQYYAYMLFRSNFIVALLDSNISTWLVESDAVWLEDPTTSVLGMKGDTVTMNDDMWGSETKGNGGFQLLRTTPATKMAWHKLHSEQKNMITTLCNGNKNVNVLKGNEQHMMDRLRKEKKGRV